MPALKLEVARQQQKLHSVMGARWREGVVVRRGEVVEGKLVENSLAVDFGGDGAGQELVQALHLSLLLDDQIARLCQDLRQCFLTPLLTRPCHLVMTETSVTLTFTAATTSSSDLQQEPCLVFSQLRELVSFLSVRLDCALPSSSSSDSSMASPCLLSLLSPHLAPWLGDQLVRHVLAPGQTLTFPRKNLQLSVSLSSQIAGQKYLIVIDDSSQNFI